ncbi:unnamed protein product [Heterobilharzia americana]|nr:unnamed protein product [Heterobilharzia americana]
MKLIRVNRQYISSCDISSFFIQKLFRLLKCLESLWTEILDLPLAPHHTAGQLEAEIEAARLRVTDWTRLRRHPSRSRSLSHASVSTTASSLLSCSTFESGATDASYLNVATDGTTGSSCHSSCSSTCGIQLPPEMAAKLSAATLISAFLAASHDFSQDKTQDSIVADTVMRSKNWLDVCGKDFSKLSKAVMRTENDRFCIHVQVAQTICSTSAESTVETMDDGE